MSASSSEAGGCSGSQRSKRTRRVGLDALTAPGRGAAPAPCGASRRATARVVGPGQLVHARGVDLHAVDGVLRRLEARLGAGQPGQVGAPLLDADRLAAAPVDRHRRHGRRGEQARHHGEDVVGVQRVVDARRVDVDGDGVARQHHVQVDGGPATVVAVGHRQPGDRGRAARSARRPSAPCPPRRSCRCCRCAGRATRRGCRRAARPRRRRGGPRACRPRSTSSAGRHGRPGGAP